MSSFEPFEELHFAKVGSSKNYAFIHSIFTGNLLFPGKSQYMINLSYKEFVSYFAGACFAKDNKKLHLYNGISQKVGKILSSNLKFSFLGDKELEKLLLDSTLEKTLKRDIKTIR